MLTKCRKHLFHDLQPYTCFHTGCTFSLRAFQQRQLWSDHLELEHKLGPHWAEEQCSLCLEFTGNGKGVILNHYARHLEDIALAALPHGADSEAGSYASDTDSVDGISVSMPGSDSSQQSPPTESQETRSNRPIPLEKAYHSDSRANSPPDEREREWRDVKENILSLCDSANMSVSISGTALYLCSRFKNCFDFPPGDFLSTPFVGASILMACLLNKEDRTSTEISKWLDVSKAALDLASKAIESFVAEQDIVAELTHRGLLPDDSSNDSSLRFGFSWTPATRKEREQVSDYYISKLETSRTSKPSLSDSSLSNVEKRHVTHPGPRGNEHKSDGRRFCSCQQIKSSNMIACSNGNCEDQWFHWECVGLVEEPNGDWLCPNCSVQAVEQDKPPSPHIGPLLPPASEGLASEIQDRQDFTPKPLEGAYHDYTDSPPSPHSGLLSATTYGQQRQDFTPILSDDAIQRVYPDSLPTHNLNHTNSTEGRSHQEEIIPRPWEERIHRPYPDPPGAPYLGPTKGPLEEFDDNGFYTTSNNRPKPPSLVSQTRDPIITPPHLKAAFLNSKTRDEPTGTDRVLYSHDYLNGFDAYNPMLDDDPFGLSASMHFPISSKPATETTSTMSPHPPPIDRFTLDNGEVTSHKASVFTTAVPDSRRRISLGNEALVTGNPVSTNEPAVDRRTRSACDACRRRKIRCARREGEMICAPCKRLELECIFGQKHEVINSGEKGKPATAATNTMSEKLPPTETTGFFQRSSDTENAIDNNNDEGLQLGPFAMPDDFAAWLFDGTPVDPAAFRFHSGSVTATAPPLHRRGSLGTETLVTSELVSTIEPAVNLRLGRKEGCNLCRKLTRRCVVDEGEVVCAMCKRLKVECTFV
jgi:hypothetical protein